MLERIAIVLSVFVFGFWGWGIIAEPQKAPIAGWIAWTVICLSIAIARWYNKQPAKMWFIFSAGDIVLTILILAIGGRNWAFENNIVFLLLGAISLIFSLKFGKVYPKLSELLGGVSLACAYVPLVGEWWQTSNVVPVGLIIAAIMSIVSPLLVGIHSHKATGIFGIGNKFAIGCATVFLTVLLIGAKRGK